VVLPLPGLERQVRALLELARVLLEPVQAQEQD
jgi:hypothetical protein